MPSARLDLSEVGVFLGWAQHSETFDGSRPPLYNLHR